MLLTNLKCQYHEYSSPAAYNKRIFKKKNEGKALASVNTSLQISWAMLINIT